MFDIDMTALSIPWHEAITWMFVIANGGRIVAYLPQIMAAWYCPTGARSVSILTWSYFAFAHLTALLYARFVLHDPRSVWIFSGNLVVTVCLVGLLLWKRYRYRLTLQIPDSSGAAGQAATGNHETHGHGAAPATDDLRDSTRLEMRTQGI